MFRPGSKGARSDLGPDSDPIVSFVGRGTAAQRYRRLHRCGCSSRGVQLLVVGRPSGPAGESRWSVFGRWPPPCPGPGVILSRRPHAMSLRLPRREPLVIVPRSGRLACWPWTQAAARRCRIPVGSLACESPTATRGFLIAGHGPAEYAAALRAILGTRHPLSACPRGRLNTPPGSPWESHR